MKKKIILSMLIVIATMCLFAISINATAINKDTAVTLNGSFTIGEESVTNPVVNVYDEEGYALVWYLNSDNKLVSDRAVNLITVTDNKAKFNDVSKFYGGTQQKGVVVVNLRDDFVSDGIKGVEKFDSNFQFGYWGANKSSPIQYFYFPVTATEIIDRMFQQTQLIIADIEPGTPISYMGTHAVAQSNLKEFFVPNDIPEFIEKDNVGVFQDTQLEKITFEEGSQITVIPYYCFYMCRNLKEVILPNSVEEVHERAFQFSFFDANAKLEKLVLGANFKTFKSLSNAYYFVRGSGSLKEVYLPATFNAENIDANTAYQLFTFCPNAVFYYCGTEEAWDELIAKIPLNKNGETGDDSNTYIINAKENGRVVFNYNACDAFYNGEHTYATNSCITNCKNCTLTDIVNANGEHNNAYLFSSKSDEYAEMSYLSFIYRICQCQDCKTVSESEDIGTIFTTTGYSCDQVNGDAIMQNFGVDKEALKRYCELAEIELSYGLVAANGAINCPDVNGVFVNNVISIDFTNRSYDLMEMKIYGLKNGHQSTKLYCCAYIKVGNDIVYIDDGAVVDTPSTKSYNDIAGVQVEPVSLDVNVPTNKEQYV
ncbi:MAG: leucine-rich repeat protein [Clostridia bacterium]|nr:leucine-rich repeat protein [Clostridia bacterium]